eukprot:615308-Rhodomonas_salina.1
MGHAGTRSGSWECSSRYQLPDPLHCEIKENNACSWYKLVRDGVVFPLISWATERGTLFLNPLPQLPARVLHNARF